MLKLLLALLSSALLARYTGEMLPVEAVASPPVFCVVSPVYRRNVTC